MTFSASSTPAVFPTPFKTLNSNSLFLIASLGIHSLILLLVLPKLMSPPTLQSTGPQAVDLIELNKAEQSRLPDLSSQSFDINDLTLPDVSNIPDLPSPNLDIDANLLQSALPDLPPLPPALPPLTYNYRTNLPITVTPRSIPPISSSRFSWPTPRSYSPPLPPVSDFPSPNLPGLPESQARPDFGELRPPIPADELINRRFNVPTLPSTSPDVAIAPPFSPEKPPSAQPLPTNPQQQAQALQDQRIRRLVASTLQGAESLRYDNENTSNDAALRNDVTWLAKVKAVKPKSTNLVGNYPKAACLRQLEGTAVYGISVDAQGQVAQPYLIKSSGYPLFNQQALQQIKGAQFDNGSGQVQPYRVSVNFNYNDEICPAVAVRQAPTPKAPDTPPNPSQPQPIPVNPPAAIQKVPEAQPNPSQPQPIPVNPPAAIQKVPEAQPNPSQPQPIPVNPPAAIQKVPDFEPKPEPKPENTPPAPSAIRKVPEPQTPQVKPQPIQENTPPAPSATRKTPNPAPEVVREQLNPKAEPIAPAIHEEATPLGTTAPRKGE